MTRLAVLGGGQLGRMLGLAGIPLDVSCSFLDPVEGAPASAVGTLVVGELDDVAAAQRAAAGAEVVTFEWEGVPARTARALAADVRVDPSPAALEASQDRLVEKQLFGRLGIATAPYRAVDDLAGLRAAVDELGLPGILKRRRGGYDGKGQALLREAGDADHAWEALGGAGDLILEGFVPFERELSIVAVRSRVGETAAWPVVENRHAEGILRRTLAPAPGAPETQVRAEACITPLLESFDYVGVCCVELFDVGGELVANEFAPRVHNSGHWSIEGADTSQFENHVRAVLGWPLGSTALRQPSAMVNCIGTMPEREAVLQVPGAHLHDYGKAPRPGRKLGHITITAPDVATLDERLARVELLVE